MRLLTLILPVLLSSCFSYNDVVFKGVQDVKVKKFDKNGFMVTAIVALDNPNPYKITVKDPDVDVFLNGLYLGKAVLDERVVLKRRSSELYTIPLHAKVDGGVGNMLAAVIGAAISGKGDLRLRGTVTGGLGFLLRKKFPFDETEAIELRLK